MKNSKCGVYKISCLINNKVYIGSSKNIQKRWDSHKRELNNNRHCNMFLQDDWNKYGKESFNFEILELCDEEDRFDLEQKYINDLLPFNRNNNGYNICENSKRKENENIKIFRNRYHRLNPFYKLSKESAKRMIKNDLEKYSEYVGKDINTSDRYEWFNIDLDGSYVQYNGMFDKKNTRFISNDIIDNNTKEGLQFILEGLDTYDMICSEMKEFGDPDDCE